MLYFILDNNIVKDRVCPVFKRKHNMCPIRCKHKVSTYFIQRTKDFTNLNIKISVSNSHREQIYQFKHRFLSVTTSQWELTTLECAVVFRTNLNIFTLSEKISVRRSHRKKAVTTSHWQLLTENFSRQKYPI